jgi:soluble lytic murein transglycosylase-like protein
VGFNLSGEMSDGGGYNFGNKNLHSTSPYSLQVYTSIEKYSKQYDIPKYIAYNIAYLETTYQGPFDWRYNHDRISNAGAVGPMQLMPIIAKDIYDKNISQNKMRKDIELNVKTSAKFLAKLYKRYGDWGKVCGYYNTGKPILNDYARYAVNNKNYKSKWVEVEL